MPLKKYFTALLIVSLFFILPLTTNAEVIPYEEQIQTKSTDALSWSYSLSGAPSGLSRTSSPLISYSISIEGDSPYELRMLLDGEKVNAQYDTNAGKLTYQAANLTGTHTVKIELQVGRNLYTPAQWSFTIDSNPVNPYKNMDETLLQKVNNEAIIRLNQYRSKLQLAPFQLNESLKLAAQAHSNYLAFNNVSGHYETKGNTGFTGVNPGDRAAYFDFNDSLSEGISYSKKTGSLGVDDLMDAPYHRLSIINPHHYLAGIGYNTNGDIIIKYGHLLPTQIDSSIVLYPYDGQQDAKATWFVAENPNPLRFWNKDQIYVGYPISYSYHPVNSTDKLVVESYSLKDAEGKTVDVYDVTPTRDDQGKNHVFLIPTEPLKVNHKYTASINAYVEDRTGIKTDTSRTWSFKTAAALDIEDIYFSKSNTTNFINVQYNNGVDPNAIITINKGDQEVIRYENRLQWTRQPLAPGAYTLTIESPLYNETKTIPITISANTNKRYEKDGDWLVTWDKETPADNIAPILKGIEDVTVEMNSIFDVKAGVTATDDVDGNLTSAIVIEGTVDVTKAGTYKITYSVKDKAGNETKQTRTITVTETEAEAEQPTIPATTKRLIEIAETIVYVNKDFKTVAKEMLEILKTISPNDYALLPEETIVVLDEIESKYNQMQSLTFNDSKPWKTTQTIKDSNKSWTITFSQAVLNNTQSREAIKIVNMFGEKILADITIIGDTVTVKPTASYIVGVPYTLVVGQGLYNTTNVPLAEAVHLEFVLNTKNEP